MAKQLIPFNTPWRQVPTAWIDFETTGCVPLVDAAVEVALVRFERGEPVGHFASRINPGRPIPPDSTEIHGISDADVADAPSITDVFDRPEVLELLEGAQPGAYNAGFDKLFVPPGVLPHDWPWVDALVAVQALDPYVKGKGRYQLTTACERHGIELENAHSALADCEASGRLFWKLAEKLEKTVLKKRAKSSIGDVIARLEVERIKRWYDFHTWLAKQPPLKEQEEKPEPLTEPTPRKCSSCGASILWTTTESGARSPVDAVPNQDGNVRITTEMIDGRTVIYGHAINGEYDGIRYMSHWATCPHANEHRRKSA